MSGLYLYFSCLDEAHSIAQDLPSVEGSYWHGIMHRQEPDPGNAGYWFRHLGRHPIFPALRERAEAIGIESGNNWDPLAFVSYCEEARKRPGSPEERTQMNKKPNQPDRASRRQASSFREHAGGAGTLGFRAAVAHPVRSA